MKDKILILAVVLSIGCLFIAIQATQTVKQNQSFLEKERYNRMVSEEKLEDMKAQNSKLANELVNSQNQVQNIQTILERQKDANDKLRDELNKVTKLNNVLEKELKEALVR